MDLTKGNKGDIEIKEATVALTKEKPEKEAATEAAKATEAKAAETKERDAAVMTALHRQKGQRENEEAEVDLTKSDEEGDGTEEDNDNNGLQNSMWAKQVHPANTTQRKKKQTSMARKKPNHITVLYIEARGTQGTTSLEVIRHTVAKVFTEISVSGKITGIKLMTNNGIGTHKPISSASMVPLK